MLGYASIGYMLCNIEKNKIIVPRDVQFNENDTGFDTNIPEINKKRRKPIRDLEWGFRT